MVLAREWVVGIRKTYCSNRIKMIRLEVLNDTIMIHIGQDQQIIQRIFIEKGQLSSSEVHDEILKQGNDISLVTIKRTLSEMKDSNLLEISGAGRSVAYKISSLG